MIQGPMGFEEIGEEEDFAAMLEESFKNEKSDRVVEGVIVDIKDDYASVDVGKKIEGRLPVFEIKNKDGSFKFAVGDKVKVNYGAKTYNGGSLALFVYTNVYEVMQAGSGDREDYIVIGQGGQVTAAVRAEDLTKI